MNSLGSKNNLSKESRKPTELCHSLVVDRGDNYTVSFITLSAVQSINQVFTKMAKRRVKPINLLQYESSVDEEQNVLFTLQLQTALKLGELCRSLLENIGKCRL